MSREAAYARDSCRIAKFDGLPPKDWDKKPRPLVKPSQPVEKRASASLQPTIRIK